MAGHAAAPSARQAMAGVRVQDPATRDQDLEAWRRGRFAERVRREWNPVRSPLVAAAGDDLDALADAIHATVGGDRASIRARLELFKSLEEGGAAAAPDPMVRPGAPV